MQTRMSGDVQHVDDRGDPSIRTVRAGAPQRQPSARKRLNPRGRGCGDIEQPPRDMVRSARTSAGARSRASAEIAGRRLLADLPMITPTARASTERAPLGRVRVSRERGIGRHERSIGVAGPPSRRANPALEQGRGHDFGSSRATTS